MVFNNAASLTLEQYIIPYLPSQELTPTRNKQKKKEDKDFQKDYLCTPKETKLIHDN